MHHPPPPALSIAVIGAGPVGLALALHAARLLPRAQLAVFDARPADKDVSGDPRTLALSLGSVQFLERLGAWAAERAQPITGIHVSQQPPSPGDGVVRMAAAELGVDQLGAVQRYGAVVAPLQRVWEAAVAAEPERLFTRFGAPVDSVVSAASGVDVSAAGHTQRFDLAVIAEGGVFAEQARKAVTRPYGQTAWVGQVQLQGGTPGLAFERFTRHGPAALLPLPPGPDGALSAALVWCVPDADDPVRELDEAQRLVVLNSIFPAEAGQLVGLSPLKQFALGLNAERTLVDGRTIRIGNAAQTLHPVAGQGLNLGLRDAAALVQTLRRESHGRLDVDAALRRVEWARAADRWTMIATTDFLARSFTWTLPGAATARGLGLAALQALPPVKQWLARRMMFGAR